MISTDNQAVTALYDQINEATLTLKTALKVPYLDALIETCDNLENNGHVNVENDAPDKETVAKLKQLYSLINLHQYDADQIRQAWQLAVLKGMRDQHIEANKQLTPDAIGLLVVFLIETFTKLNNNDQILDLAVGTGNLLATILNHLQSDLNIKLTGIGIDNDEDLLALASSGFALEKLDVNLYHQDSMDSLMVKNAAIAVSDLPVGYYPQDNKVKNFATHAENLHSYAHHLLIEQSMHYVKPNGFGFFIVPSQLFSSDQAKLLMNWMSKEVYFQGLLNLPKSFFMSESAQKSVLVLQKPGDQAKQAKTVLVGEFPDFHKREEFSAFLQQIRQWYQNNLK